MLSLYLRCLGEIGRACNMQLVLNSINAITLAGLAEGMALASSSGVSQDELLCMLTHTSLNCPMILEKAKGI